MKQSKLYIASIMMTALAIMVFTKPTVAQERGTDPPTSWTQNSLYDYELRGGCFIPFGSCGCSISIEPSQSDWLEFSAQDGSGARTAACFLRMTGTPGQEHIGIEGPFTAIVTAAPGIVNLSSGFDTLRFSILVEDVNDPPSKPEILSPVADRFLGGDPGAEISFEWTESVDLDPGITIQYEHQISASQGFDASLTLTTNTSATQFKKTTGEMALLLDSWGAELNVEKTLYQRVSATDIVHTIFSDLVTIGMTRSTIDHAEEVEIPGAFDLHQNYPNPFNPATTIRYAIPKHSHVVVTLFDAMGRLKSRLVDQPQAPGWYTVDLDGGGLASGVYFYRIEAGSYVNIRSATLLK